jgi:hypothetical protein
LLVRDDVSKALQRQDGTLTEAASALADLGYDRRAGDRERERIAAAVEGDGVPQVLAQRLQRATAECHLARPGRCPASEDRRRRDPPAGLDSDNADAVPLGTHCGAAHPGEGLDTRVVGEDLEEVAGVVLVDLAGDGVEGPSVALGVVDEAIETGEKGNSAGQGRDTDDHPRHCRAGRHPPMPASRERATAR